MVPWSWARPADLGQGHGAALAHLPVPPGGLSLLLPHLQAFPGSTWWRPVGKRLRPCAAILSRLVGLPLDESVSSSHLLSSGLSLHLKGVKPPVVFG